MIRDIVLWPNPILREKSKEVSELTEEVLSVITDLQDTHAHVRGAGLSAVQIGNLLRIILVIKSDPYKSVVLINPKILEFHGPKLLRTEGCLSIPGRFELIERYASVTVAGMLPSGQDVAYVAQGIEAHAIQHEIEHLDGIIYLDHLGDE